MKVTWETEDIRPGRRYSRADISEVWMIGYDPELGEQFASVSLLDGLITDFKTRERMAKDLTENGYVPLELMEGKS